MTLAELRLLTKTSLASYCQWASNGTWLPARHLEYTAERLEALALGRIKRLMVLEPPQNGKSDLASGYFPAWFIGNWPTKRILLGAYEAGFAATWGSRAKGHYTDSSSIFPSPLADDSQAKDHWRTKAGGGMDTAGIGGAFTGKGADCFIVDDPVKNPEQAASQVYRDKTWDWYRAAALTRLSPDGRVLLIMTRWHEDDLAGRILQQAAETGEQWEVVNLPALAEEGDILGRAEGEPLWPERYPLEWLLEKEQAVGSRIWASLYQQRPTMQGGDIFRREWLRYYHVNDAGAYLLTRPDGATIMRPLSKCRRFQTCDLAVSEKTTADYFVLATWAVTEQGELLLLDRIRAHLAGPDQPHVLRQEYHKWNPASIYIESVAYQLSLVQQVIRNGLPAVEMRPDKDKVSRALLAATRFEAGTVYLPQGASWLGEYEQELLTFPNAKHDDQVDVTSMACEALPRMTISLDDFAVSDDYAPMDGVQYGLV